MKKREMIKCPECRGIKINMYSACNHTYLHEQDENGDWINGTLRWRNYETVERFECVDCEQQWDNENGWKP